MEKAVIIKTDGTKEVVEFEIGKSYDLLSKSVEGWIECVSLVSRNADMWVNEEGKLNGLPENHQATALWVEEYGMTDIIVGNIIITGGVDHEGETLGLSDEQVSEFMEYNRRVLRF
jgi:Domain of unknown function (DUF3846)